jgi:hypothetical protein
MVPTLPIGVFAIPGTVKFARFYVLRLERFYIEFAGVFF